MSSDFGRFPQCVRKLLGRHEKSAPLRALIEGRRYAKVTTAAHSARALLRVLRLGSQGARKDAVWAGVAQLVEHLICNQRVGGSNPFVSSSSMQQQYRKTDLVVLLAAPACRPPVTPSRQLPSDFTANAEWMLMDWHEPARSNVLQQLCTGGRVVNGSRL